MPYEITDENCPGDIGLIVTADTIENLFADSVLGVMSIISDIENLRDDKLLSITLREENLEDIYYAFLSELVYHIDTNEFLIKSMSISFETKNKFSLKADLFGDVIDRSRHTLKAEIKAVTYYRFKIIYTGSRWESEVIFDL